MVEIKEVLLNLEEHKVKDSEEKVKMRSQKKRLIHYTVFNYLKTIYHAQKSLSGVSEPSNNDVIKIEFSEGI